MNAVSNQKNEISYGYSRVLDAPYSEVVSRASNDCSMPTI